MEERQFWKNITRNCQLKKKKLGALHALEDLEPHFKFSKITDKNMENLKQASGEI